MKTRKISTGIMNFLILAGIVGLGGITGYFAGDYRIGIHVGVALGLMGIASYRLWRENAQGSLQEVKVNK